MREVVSGMSLISLVSQSSPQRQRRFSRFAGIFTKGADLRYAFRLVYLNLWVRGRWIQTDQKTDNYDLNRGETDLLARDKSVECRFMRPIQTGKNLAWDSLQSSSASANFTGAWPVIFKRVLH
jgi:hypothetical protein